MIRVGIGGWTYEPWRGVFYPAKLPHARELSFAAQKLTTIEINGTFYRTQRPETFRSWAEATPENFVFSLKAPRYATNRSALAEASSSIERFVESGLTELKSKLGPILWQLPPFKKFDAKDCEAFLALLPANADGLPLRHAVEVRHKSFADKAWVDLARRYSVATVFAHSDEYPCVADVTGDFVYARLQKTVEDEPAGYSKRALDAWAEHARVWKKGGAPEEFKLLAKPAKKQKRDVFIYMISGAKVRAPAAAMALIERLD